MCYVFVMEQKHQRGRTLLFPLTFVLLAFLLCFGGYSLFAFKAAEIINTKPMPAAMKLVDCKQEKSKFALRCPAGSLFNFVLGAPKAQSLKAQSFRGHPEVSSIMRTGLVRLLSLLAAQTEQVTGSLMHCVTAADYKTLRCNRTASSWPRFW